MSSPSSDGSRSARRGQGHGHGAAQHMSPPTDGAAQHAHTFKLRFASQREPGRSYVSLVKPLALPATVTGKPYTLVGCASPARGELERSALRRVQDMFRRGPRERHDRPVLSSHEYGWFWSRWVGGRSVAPRGDRRLNHHLADSAWLRARVRVLAADRALKQR